MVYCGKPSKGCFQCRRRKIKCDQGEPSCGQCLRANHTCPGYRDQLDLLFRDESQKVAKKARASSKQTELGRRQPPSRNKQAVTSGLGVGENAASGQALSDPARRHQHLQLDYTSPLPSSPLTIELKHQGLCFFASCFEPSLRVLGPTCQGYLPLIHPIVEDETLWVCMSAVGLASLSNITKSRSMWLAAGEQHARALALINARLANPEHAKSAPTLDAVMLLGMFEVITCRGPGSVHTWRRHMQGATALLKLRAREKPDNVAASRTFIQVRGQIISGCLVTHTYADPATGGLLSDWDRSGITFSDFVIESLTGLLTRLANLRAAVKDGAFSSTLEILRMALDLRDDLISFELAIKGHYDIRKVMNQEGASTFLSPEFVYGDYFHVFPDFYAVNLWNGYRSGRITLSGTIFAAFLELEASTSPSHQLPCEIYEKIQQEQHDMRQIAQDICASVPFSLEMIRWDSNTLSVNPAGACALGGFLLLWPLYLAAEAAHDMPDVRLWIIGRLEYITHTFGINQGAWMAGILKARLAIDECIASAPMSDSEL